MGDRLRLCVACESPSPGPTKRLYYQHRDYGPFFPVLEKQRKKAASAGLFSGGRAIVCTGCSSHLLRQWAAYDKNWTPLEKRVYSLLAEEREAQKASKNGISNVTATNELAHTNSPEGRSSWKRTAGKVTSQQKSLRGLRLESLSDKGGSPGRITPSSFLSEGSSPFRRAVKKVSQQNTKFMTENGHGNKPSGVVETLEIANRWGDEKSPEMPKKRSLASWNLPSEDIRSKVREELQENIDVMIRKLAEIQHHENMRKYEKDLKEATERMCRVQNREDDITRMCQHLKTQLEGELMFRDTSRVLVIPENQEKKTVEKKQNDLKELSIEATGSEKTNPNVADVTTARNAGKAWKGKAMRKKGRQRSEYPVASNDERSLVPVPAPAELSTGTSRVERGSSASRKLDGVMRELEQEREWRKKTESVIINQREMIEELRRGIQGEVQRLIDEQNKRYHEMKESLGRNNSSSKRPDRLHTNPYDAHERRISVDHDTTRNETQRPSRRRHPGDRPRDDWEAKEKNALDVHDDTDDDDDISDDDASDDIGDEGSVTPDTPEYYIK